MYCSMTSIKLVKTCSFVQQPYCQNNEPIASTAERQDWQRWIHNGIVLSYGKMKIMEQAFVGHEGIVMFS